MSPTQTYVVEWLAKGSVGSSSKAMAMWLAFSQRTDDFNAHPHDPDDFDRCLRLLAWVPLLRVQLSRMADISPEWAALVARWDEVESSHLEEVGLGWTKARSAPKTYKLMRSIIDGARKAA